MLPPLPATIFLPRLLHGLERPDEPASLREAERAAATLRLAALVAEREAIFHLAREHEISDEMSRKLVRQIELIEARHR